MATESEALPEAMDVDLPDANQRPGLLDSEWGQHEEIRASKRLCVSAEPAQQSLLQLLISKLSCLLGCDDSGGLPDLRVAMK